MTALEEIKKAEHERIWLEPAGAPDRCWCQDNQWGDEGVEYVLASYLESLQRENEALKKDRDFWKEQFQVETRYRIELADRGTLLALTDANSRAEAAEAEAKMLREALHKIESGYGANDICARIARDALSAQVQDVAKPDDELFWRLRVAYLRGAEWRDTTGSMLLVDKASYDYADKITSPLAAAPAKQEG